MSDYVKKSLLALVLVLSISASAVGSSLVGDISANGIVGWEDVELLCDYWLDAGCSAPNCAADLDGIAGVNMRDYALLATDFGWGSISVQEYRDKMKGGWVGQMVGVSWGAPTEFGWMGEIIPEGRVPRWRSNMINNAFGQDDLYVEMTFLRSLELYGLDVSIIQAGDDFANSSYELWHANYEGRNNLRSGIIPPNSGHPAYNSHADDIDYQIEADYSGLIAPGLPNAAIGLGEKFGRLMNYGDGVYGGQFVGGMYAEAFFETDMEKVVRAGLECIPVGSQYHECISDVLAWYGANPNWEDTWQLINNKYHLDPNYRRFSCSGIPPETDFNIDAKINGAYIVMGLLYGQGDPDDTITISMRCGQDSDCNPSNAAGILFTSMGYSNVPSHFKSSLNEGTYFSYTDYNFPLLMGVCEDLARQVVLQAGGSIGQDPCNPGEEIFIIPVSSPVPSELLQSWDPDPPITTGIVITSPSNGDIFGEGEMITITADACDVEGSIIKVEFFDGAAKLGEDSNEPYSFDWIGASLGAHSLQAKATDNDGNTTTSATVNISVSPPRVAGVWRSFNVIMKAAGPQGTVTDGNSVTADLE
ncbi:MAG: ADP-ribosylglycohydrolase family protein, partial [Planctomycetota bacterium]